MGWKYRLQTVKSPLHIAHQVPSHSSISHPSPDRSLPRPAFWACADVGVSAHPPHPHCGCPRTTWLLSCFHFGRLHLGVLPHQDEQPSVPWSEAWVLPWPLLHGWGRFSLLVSPSLTQPDRGNSHATLPRGMSQGDGMGCPACCMPSVAAAFLRPKVVRQQGTRAGTRPRLLGRLPAAASAGLLATQPRES